MNLVDGSSQQKETHRPGQKHPSWKGPVIVLGITVLALICGTLIVKIVEVVGPQVFAAHSDDLVVAQDLREDTGTVVITLPRSLAERGYSPVLTGATEASQLSACRMLPQSRNPILGWTASDGTMVYVFSDRKETGDIDLATGFALRTYADPTAIAGSCWGLIDQTLEVPARDLIDGEG